MYIPKHFKLNEKEGIYKIIEENSFATLFSLLEGIPFATHLPLALDRVEEVLIGHVARQNPQWKDMQHQQVLAVFHGPHSYISPSWYETNTAVPTWNYTAVHVYGEAEMIESEQELMKSLQDLVDTYEKPDSSYELDKADPAYIKGLSKGIVGFRIKITKMEGKSKLSQNHSIKRRETVIEQLEQLKSENAKHIARLMKETIVNDSES
ncbi:FMN-binding negative transcriptional regulator [Metabacillus idriensis]|uniref:FMN-binding negative transcriptional regulator n=1 Tax=Metabacillus idriensis TaxID=324768 RepID=UPI00174C22A8|nr:FMN-binding negative transcriptional regulator [Metabacillus idriensis]